MTDIVEALRAEIDADVNEPLDRLLESAAAEIVRLRKALMPFAHYHRRPKPPPHGIRSIRPSTG